jgi:hypothetical protein
MEFAPLDRFSFDGRDYIFRDRHWTSPTGYRVSTSDGQRLTVAFYERNGRLPGVTPMPPAIRAPRRGK